MYITKARTNGVSLFLGLVAAAASAASAAVYTFQDGDANGYNSCAATYTMLNTLGNRGDENFGSLTIVETENQSTGGGVGEGKKSTLVRFNDIIGSGAGQVPASDEWIYRAYVTLRTGSGSWHGSPDINAIYPILKDWDEGQVTHNSRLTGTPWGTPGLGAGDDHGATASDSLAPSALSTNYNFGVTPSVRDIIRELAPNHGWIVRDINEPGDNGALYHSDNSSTQSYRPKLTIETAPNPVGGTERTFLQQGTTANGTTDATYIFRRWDGSAGQTNNYGTSTILDVEQQTTSGSDLEGIKRALVRFPEAIGTGAGQISPGSTVVAAKLALCATDGSGGPLYGHRVLSDWHEDQATYNERLTGTAWATPGMGSGTDYEAISWPCPHSNVASGTFNELDVTAIAQAWADGADNYGLVVRSATSDGVTYASDDAVRPGDRPVLIVDTATPAWGTTVRSATAATCDATYMIKGSSGSNYGTSTAFDTDASPEAERRRALIAFPDLIGSGFNQVPEGIGVLSATLRLHTQNTSQWAGSPGTHSIYQVLTDWAEDQVTWSSFNDGGVAGTDYAATSLDSLAPSLTDSFCYFDVTESVQNWAHGQDNFGWILINSIGDRANWDSDDCAVGVYRPLLIVQWVPEPASVVLLSLGGLALLLVARRRRGRTR